MTAGHVLPLPEPVRCLACGQLADDGTCPITIECLRCGAAPGERCRHPNGHATSIHVWRLQRARNIDRFLDQV
jgi:hypothetical protein